MVKQPIKIPSKCAIVLSLISHSVSLFPMPALQGAVQLLPLNEDCVCHKLWEPLECSKSSTWRELAAIDISLESFAPIKSFTCQVVH